MAAGQESSPGRKSASTAAWLCTGSRTLYGKVTRGSRPSISRKQHRAMTTRYDKFAVRYGATLAIAAVTNGSAHYETRPEA